MLENKTQSKEEYKNKYLLIIITLLIVAGVVVYYVVGPGKKNVAYQKALVSLSEKEAILILDYGEKERWFKGEVREGMTVANVIQASSLAGNFSYKLNSHLTSIDNISNNGKESWHCYINNELIDSNLVNQKVNPKDRIVCRYRYK